ncbi:MAG: hypothetical protein IJZ08_00830 [Clostridia bacterium]|nr:hypothetical protein [Clostridia bacterium]
MNIQDRLIEAAARALHVPLMPAPGGLGVPSAVYRCFPGRSDGALCAARLEVRVFHHSLSAAAEEIEALSRAIVSDGDTGILGKGGDSLVVCRTADGAGSGYLRGTDLYFVKAAFEAEGRV